MATDSPTKPTRTDTDTVALGAPTDEATLSVSLAKAALQRPNRDPLLPLSPHAFDPSPAKVFCRFLAPFGLGAMSDVRPKSDQQ